MKKKIDLFRLDYVKYNEGGVFIPYHKDSV